MRFGTVLALFGAVLAITCGAEVAWHGPLFDLDRRVALSFWPIAPGWQSSAGFHLADIGRPELACLTVGGLALLVAWLRKQRGPLLAAAIGLGCVGVATLLLKETFPTVGIWGHPGSFPSGHTGVAVVASGLVTYLVLPARQWRENVVVVVGMLWGLVMAWGRLVIETHWLSDVIAGWGIGAIALVLAIRSADSPLGTREWRRSTPADTR